MACQNMMTATQDNSPGTRHDHKSGRVTLFFYVKQYVSMSVKYVICVERLKHKSALSIFSIFQSGILPSRHSGEWVSQSASDCSVHMTAESTKEPSQAHKLLLLPMQNVLFWGWRCQFGLTPSTLNNTFLPFSVTFIPLICYPIPCVCNCTCDVECNILGGNVPLTKVVDIVVISNT